MKTAKLFQNGHSQAVRLPKEFRFEGKEVWIARVGDCTILRPTSNPWRGFEESLEQFSEDFMSERPAPLSQTREECFE